MVVRVVVQLLRRLGHVAQRYAVLVQLVVVLGGVGVRGATAGGGGAGLAAVVGEVRVRAARRRREREDLLDHRHQAQVLEQLRQARHADDEEPAGLLRRDPEHEGRHVVDRVGRLDVRHGCG